MEPGAEFVFGYSAAEVVGKSLAVIIPERFDTPIGKASEGPSRSQTKYGDRVLTTRSVRKDGSKLYVDLSFGLVRDLADAVVAAFAIGRDCTTRHLSDSAFRARVSDLEQRLEVASKVT